jgi:hypothetical protein
MRSFRILLLLAALFGDMPVMALVEAPESVYALTLEPCAEAVEGLRVRLPGDQAEAGRGSRFLIRIPAGRAPC